MKPINYYIFFLACCLNTCAYGQNSQRDFLQLFSDKCMTDKQRNFIQLLEHYDIASKITVNKVRMAKQNANSNRAGELMSKYSSASKFIIDVGNYSEQFFFEHTQDTRLTSDAYHPPYWQENESPNDVFYSFTIEVPMAIFAKTTPGTCIYLEQEDFDSDEDQLTPFWGGHVEANFFAAVLPIGTYYVISEGDIDDNGLIFNGEIETMILAAPNRLEYNLGAFMTDTLQTVTGDTQRASPEYKNNPHNDIYYSFTLEQYMSLSASTNEFSSCHVNLYLLDSSEKEITSSKYGELKVEDLSPGNYYLVVEEQYDAGIFSLDLEWTAIYHEIHPNASNQNYIMTRTYTKADGTESRININYYDGLSRPIEAVRVGSSPLGKDIITRQDYDDSGRLSREWLPRVSESSNGKFVTYPDFERLSQELYGYDPHPYSKIVYEKSPLNRVLEQYGPGDSWHSNNKSVTSAYQTNISGNITLECKFYQVGGNRLNPTLSQSGYYVNGELYVTEVKDEDGNMSFKFKDKLDQVVLTRQIEGSVLYDTYYVYDDFGNQCFVLPPRINDEGITQNKLDELAYQYRYDGQNRCIAKKKPGCDWNYYIYDESDRPIFSQDGEQRTKQEWMFSVYDAFNRVVLTGVCKNSFDYMANPLKTIVVKATWAGCTNTTKGYTVSGVTLISPIVLSANYYDSYNFMGINNILDSTDTDFKPEIVENYGMQYKGGYKGLLTGTLTAQINTDGLISSSYLYSVLYYDNRKRLIQTKSNNHLAGGINKEYIAYDFTGQVVQRKRIHHVTGKTPQTEIYTYVYDHAGRLLTTKHQLNTNPVITIKENIYDELGRLKITKRNNQANLEMNYTYNIRSWIKSITSSLFKENLYYNDSRTNGTNISCYNGNISGIDWKVLNDKERGYNFSYDNLSRLTGATYLESKVLSDKFSTSYSYDKHGNILSLSRHGNVGTTTYGVIDNLILCYDGNQLVSVEDEGTNPTLSMSMDFKDGAHESVEYVYDANGNMVKDLNKGISRIEYNFLNLPRRITFSGISNPMNEYIYSTTGQKQTVFHHSSTDKRTDYVGNMVYENGALTHILVDGGYIDAANGVYYFYLQDHLGNNRVVADQEGTIFQTNHYYPYGMSFAEGGVDRHKQPYQYNGKELDMKNGLNWYDYEARMMDSHRFTTPDPMAEKYYSWSPYVYCLGNPLKYIDPNGETVWIYFNDPKGEQHRMLYTANMSYKGNNTFLSEAIGTLNVIYNNGGNRMLTTLINSRNDFNIKNILARDNHGKVISAFSFKENPNGGGDIYAGLLMDPRVSKFNKIKGLSHELFHALQHEKGQGGASVHNEIEARVFSKNVASNWAFSTEEWLQANTSEGLGNDTYAGDRYTEAFSLLEQSYSTIVFKIASEYFKTGSASNASGLYNTYPLRRINQKESLLKQYFVKQQ